MLTSWLQGLALATMLLTSIPAWAFEFSDYDHSRYAQEMTDCDRLAAHGRDPGHIGPPVTRAEMNIEAAIVACRAAVAKDPDNPRLNYQMGRALGYANRGSEAMPYRLKAVAADYPQSTFVIGYLHLLGSTIDQDSCRAQELWIRSARYRRLAALVALPRHTLRGDFDSCPMTVSAEDMAAMLNEASDLSSDYYIGMLIQLLQEQLAADLSGAAQ